MIQVSKGCALDVEFVGEYKTLTLLKPYSVRLVPWHAESAIDSAIFAQISNRYALSLSRPSDYDSKIQSG